MLISRAESADSYDEITALLHRAYAGLAAQGLNYKAASQSAEDTRRRSAGAECYIARVEGRVVGTLLVVGPERPAPWSKWYDQPGVAMLGQFGVEPGLHGQGIGSRLLSFGEERVFELGAREVSIDTAVAATRLVHFYRSRGYREVETVQWDHASYLSVIMSKARPAG
ncbi:MAG TPA: GNAT family N-acetyltransferase [Polyangiaceae bacterium]|jgi:GNAT superfamily N-acetyltransferase|nr:GNAT family N-acetyltransferase [Polyangiaceae bacterium]